MTTISKNQSQCEICIYFLTLKQKQILIIFIGVDDSCIIHTHGVFFLQNLKALISLKVKKVKSKVQDHISVTFFFYKHIKIQGLGSNMLKVTQHIGWKYAYDMLTLCVRIFKMKSYSMEFKSKKQICYTKSGSNKAYLSFHLKIVEVNGSRYMATFEVRGSNEKLCFCINYEDCAIHIFHFSCTELSHRYFFGRYFFLGAKSVGLLYLELHYLWVFQKKEYS